MSGTNDVRDLAESLGPAERELTTLLSQLLPAPETSLAKARVRARVMTAARDQLEPHPSPLLRPIGLAAAAASAVVALGSGGAIGASANALPGEPLYSVKLAVEEVHSAIAAVAGDPVAQVAVEDERASKRVAEMEALAAQNKPIPAAVSEAALTRSAAAAAAAAKVPEAQRPDVEQKREAAQAKREDTLTRVITQVPPPAKTAIANTLERHEEKRIEEQRRVEARRDEPQTERPANDQNRGDRQDDRDDRTNNRGPGASSNSSSNSGPGNARLPQGAPAQIPPPRSTPPPTATPRPTQQPNRRPPNPTNSRPDNPGRGNSDSDNSGSGSSGGGNSGRSR